MTITKLIIAGSSLAAAAVIAVNPAFFPLAVVARNSGQIGRLSLRKLRGFWSDLKEGTESRDLSRSRIKMKTAVTVFFVFALQAAGSAFTSGHPPAVMDVFASALAACLAGWTVRQCHRKFLPLTLPREAQLHFVDPCCTPSPFALRKVA